MSHFAKINGNNIVTEVIVSEKDFINSGVVGDEFLWIQTSYNNNFRKNFAGVGYTYDVAKNIFIAPKPYSTWSLDSNNDWQPPTAMPDDGKYYTWNEATTNWEEIT